MLVSLQSELTNPDELAVVKTSLDKHTKGCIIYDDILSKPTHDQLDTLAHFIKQSRADIVMAYGSRDTFHAARAAALLARNEIFSAELNQDMPLLQKAPLPVVMAPVSPAMGEESTPAFSVYDEVTNNLYFGVDNRLFPSLVFVDPNISVSLTGNELARGGVAILAASIEAILSKKANEITSSIALRAIELVTRNLVTLVNEPGNMPARMSVCMASLLCGMAHSNSLLGICYSIAGAINHLSGLDFFLGMAIMLPHVMEYNLTTSAGKYVQIAKSLDEDIKDITVIEAAIKAVEGVRKIYLELKIPQRLSDFEIEKATLPEIAQQAFQMPLTKNSPREMDRHEIETILIAAY